MRLKSKKLISVEPTPVYDLTINDRTPCFELDSGVISHNTKRWKSPIHTIPNNCELRSIYRARHDDSLIMHFDYSAQEVKTIAALSGDENMLELLATGADVHMMIASKVWRCDPSEVSQGMRRYSKMVVFSILYGKSPETLAADLLKGDLAAAKTLFDDFFTAFPKVKEFIEKCHTDVMRDGFVRTIFGDPLYIDITGNKGEALRASQNWPVQSSSSSLASYAIYLVYEKLLSRSLNAFPVGFTHDSCELEFKARDLFEVIDTVREIAVDFVRKRFNIPVTIDWEIGASQDSLVELEEISRTDISRTFEFSGSNIELDEIIRKLRTSFEVEFEVTGTKESYFSLMELFVTRRAFSRTLGTTTQKVSGELKLTKKF